MADTKMTKEEGDKILSEIGKYSEEFWKLAGDILQQAKEQGVVAPHLQSIKDFYFTAKITALEDRVRNLERRGAVY